MNASAILLSSCIAAAGLAIGEAEAETARRHATAQGIISVEVSNLRSGGSVLVALFDGPKAFPSFKGQIAAKRIAVSGAAAQAVFENIPYGRYAVAVVHDENGNGRLDTRLGVIPTEPIGFSNGARIGRFGPPSYEAAAFDLGSKRRTIRIAVD